MDFRGNVTGSVERKEGISGEARDWRAGTRSRKVREQ
jgi:hypothetical protein